MQKTALKVAVVGCGAISDVYLRNMIHRFTNLEVVACCAAHLEHAQRKAADYGIRACTYGEILQDSSIDMVVILTPAPTHCQLIRDALMAGKHVYTEKTMTLESTQAAQLLELANSRGLYLGSAPDTFLGSALQTARCALDEGLIGEVTSFQVSANRELDYYASKYGFLRLPGGGICFDYGVYHLTALVSLLGPMRSVAAVVQNRNPVRVNCVPDSPEFGQEFSYPNESQLAAILQTRGGVSGCFSLNGDSVRKDQALFVLYGTKGILKLSDPNTFGGDVILIPNTPDAPDAYAPQKLENRFAFSEDSRGVGPAEMADAILCGRPNRARKEMAYHVLDVLEQIMRSSAERRFVEIKSSCTRPAPFPPEASAAWTRR